jgi:hypothetical protein
MMSTPFSDTPSEAPADNNNPPRASLLGLPREIRALIYDQFPIRRMDDDTEPIVLLWTFRDGSTKYEMCPPLLHTCAQIRAETEEDYFTNQFRIELDALVKIGESTYIESDLQTPMRAFEHLVWMKGCMGRLRALQHLTLEINFSTACGGYRSMEFRVYLDKNGELRPFWRDRICAYIPVVPIERDEYALKWHYAVTESRRARNGWRGEGIVDYFLGETDFWKTWFWSYPDLRKMRVPVKGGKQNGEEEISWPLYEDQMW